MQNNKIKTIERIIKLKLLKEEIEKKVDIDN